MKPQKVYTGKAKCAKEGIHCRICKTWLKKGERKANQTMCCNDDSRKLTDCQKKYYKEKRDKISKAKAPFDYGYIICDVCKKEIKKEKSQQKRCMSKAKGKLSDCQKKYLKAYAKKYNDAEPSIKPVITGNKTKRLCLKCGEMFPSDHAYNRICDKCALLNDKETRIQHRILRDGNLTDSQRAHGCMLDDLVAI